MRVIIIAILISYALFYESASAEDIVYVGSYTNVRASDTGHIYIYELRLWKSGSAVLGAILVIAGLEGGGIPPIVERITGELFQSGSINILSASYSFTGTYKPKELKGELRQGNELIWGGIEGSNDFVFRKGSSIQSVPEKQFKSAREIDAWVEQLK